MKKQLLAILVTTISVLTATNQAFSQQAFNEIIHYTTMEDAPRYPGSLSVTEVNTKALRHFRQTYGTVEDERWYKIRDGFSVEFTSDDIKFKVQYDIHGSWNGTEKNYPESKLDRTVRAMVKSVYYDYAITWIREISLADLDQGPIYLIHIEDEKSFKNIGVFGEEVKILEEYQKAL